MAEAAGFELFITADQELTYQQNWKSRDIAVLILTTNNWGVIQQQAATILLAIDGSAAGSLTVVDISATPEVDPPSSPAPNCDTFHDRNTEEAPHTPCATPWESPSFCPCCCQQPKPLPTPNK